jgi:hypothetical protein
MFTDRQTGDAPAGSRQVLENRQLLERLLQDGACDLHLHTTESDGSDTPQQLVDRVLAAGLKSFAITDHDRIAANTKVRDYLDRLLAGQKSKNLLPFFIPGVELSTDLDGNELHLLGYFPSGGAQQLTGFLDEQLAVRQTRNRQMIRRLQDLGYAVSLSAFEASGEGATGRLQAAVLLVRHGYVSSIQEAFETILGEGKPGYVSRYLPPIFAAIERIHQAGGLAVLAHPDLYGWCSGNSVVDRRLLEALARLSQAGLDGVEAYHGEAPQDRQSEVAAAGKSLGLVLTAGSDDHGVNKGQVLMYDRNSCWPARKEWLVAGALLSRADDQGQLRYLICRRRSPGRHAGFWELPGGKVEPGESVADALRRELREELAVDAHIGPLQHVLWHDYPGERVILAVLDAKFDTGQMAEYAHDRFLFVTAEEALKQTLLPADVTLFHHLAEQDRR